MFCNLLQTHGSAIYMSLNTAALHLGDIMTIWDKQQVELRLLHASVSTATNRRWAVTTCNPSSINRITTAVHHIIIKTVPQISWHFSMILHEQIQAEDILGWSMTLDRSTSHPKLFDRSEVWTHDLQIMTVHFMSLRCRYVPPRNYLPI